MAAATNEYCQRMIGQVFAHAGEDFGGDGILYHIGTRGGTQSYVNPAVNGDVGVEVSSPHIIGKDTDVVEHLEPKYNRTDSIPGSWVAIRMPFAVIPHRYSLRHGRDDSNYVLRNWVLEASVTGEAETWTVLVEHVNDESLANRMFSTASWDISMPDKYIVNAFVYFRIRMTGQDSSQGHYLHVGGLELFGQVSGTPGIVRLQLSLLNFSRGYASVAKPILLSVGECVAGADPLFFDTKDRRCPKLIFALFSLMIP